MSLLPHSFQLCFLMQSGRMPILVRIRPSLTLPSLHSANHILPLSWVLPLQAQKITDNIKGKVCSMAICAVAWLVAHVRMLGRDEREKPQTMIRQLVTPLYGENTLQFYNERYKRIKSTSTPNSEKFPCSGFSLIQRLSSPELKVTSFSSTISPA